MKKIMLAGGQVALVDDEDFQMVSQYRWMITGAGYAYAQRKNGVKVSNCLYLHRLIMGAKQGEVVDHQKHRPLDCRKLKLRIGSQSKNMANSMPISTGRKRSAFKGVKKPKSGKFIAQVMVNRKSIYLGSFRSELEAAKAYDKAAKKYFGDFALTNKKLGLL